MLGGLAFFASLQGGVVTQALVPEKVLLFLFEDADGGGEVVVAQVEVEGEVVVDRLGGFLDR